MKLFHCLTKKGSKSQHLKRFGIMRRLAVKKVFPHSVAKWVGQVRSVLLQVVALIPWREEFIYNYLYRRTESQ